MKERRLFILVEGNDDDRFFSRIIRPLFADMYASVEIVMYACMKNEKVNRFVRSIIEMGHEFMLCADIDREESVRAKKKVLNERYGLFENDHMVIIIKEIESWYLAGLDERAQQRLGIRQYGSTDHITKEIFNGMIPRHYTSRIAFMGDIITLFSPLAARERNRSFAFFCQKYHLLPDEAHEETIRGYRDIP
jgi:hypothetical protein